MRIEKLNSDNEKQWNSFLDNYDGQVTIAHNPTTSNIVEKTFKFEDASVLLYDGEKVIGVFPCCWVGNTLVSLPHFSYGGVLVMQDYSLNEAYSEIIDYFDSDYEIRSFHEVSGEATAEVNDSKVSAFLELKNSGEEQMDYFDGDKRTEIRKGFKEGIESTVGGIELLDEFYSVYSEIMHRLGSPVLTKSLFENILELYDYGDSQLFINYLDGKPISGSIIMTYKDFVEVPWAASLWEYSKLGANNLLYWNMISYSIENDHDIFSFGRSTEGSGSHRFKKKWGTVNKQLYFNLSDSSEVNVKKLDFLADIWSKIPKPIADKIGPFFSKKVY